jgi:uncharacterized Ntn-hydrolase superfamily protein
MKSNLVIWIGLIVNLNLIHAQDTFSVVAADSTTREVGSAGASCVDLFAAGFSNIGFLGDLLPDTGAINTQAAYITGNQNNARKRMRSGDTPAQIVSWLSANDASFDPTVRQYGIVGFNGNIVSAAGYTGFNCLEYKNHITGSIDGIHYSIQGNILLGQEILDSMEYRFRNATGDLACRLMAALQGAKVIGADTRCAPNNSSTLFAFLKVAQPSDKYGSPSFSIGVRTRSGTQIEPVDSLQKLFNVQHNCIVNTTNELSPGEYLKIYPNPSNGKISILFKDIQLYKNPMVLSFINILGEKVLDVNLKTSNMVIDLSEYGRGIFIYQLKFGDDILESGKFQLELK